MTHPQSKNAVDGRRAWAIRNIGPEVVEYEREFAASTIRWTQTRDDIRDWDLDSDEEQHDYHIPRLRPVQDEDGWRPVINYRAKYDGWATYNLRLTTVESFGSWGQAFTVGMAEIVEQHEDVLLDANDAVQLAEMLPFAAVAALAAG